MENSVSYAKEICAMLIRRNPKLDFFYQDGIGFSNQLNAYQNILMFKYAASSILTADSLNLVDDNIKEAQDLVTSNDVFRKGVTQKLDRLVKEMNNTTAGRILSDQIEAFRKTIPDFVQNTGLPAEECVYVLKQ